MNPCHDYLNHLTRRQFFAGAGLAMGGLALNWLAPLPFLPADLPVVWLGALVFVLALSRLP